MIRIIGMLLILMGIVIGLYGCGFFGFLFYTAIGIFFIKMD